MVKKQCKYNEQSTYRYCYLHSYSFYGVVDNIILMIFAQYLIKLILAALDTPFFYFFTRRRKCKKLRNELWEVSKVARVPNEKSIESRGYVS